RPLLAGNLLCMRCHGGGFANAPLIDVAVHTFHQPQSAGSQCVNCHMPQTKYMQRHGRHDHGFTVPDPLLTKELGIPNACNRCHTEKDTAWALQAVDQWYGPKMERPSRTRARTIAHARTAAPSAQRDLLKLLEKEENPYWKAVAAGLLEPWAAEPSVAAALLQHLRDTNALVRTACVRA